MILGDVRLQRPWVLLAVLIGHAGIIWLLVWSERQQPSRAQSREALVLLTLPDSARNDQATAAIESSNPRTRYPLSKRRVLQSHAHKENSIANSNEESRSSIDWKREAAMAAQDSIANADRRSRYRDLSSLSPDQLRWTRENHWEPAPPGIPWKYRRVEVSDGGFPIIHINDHCILVPLMMMMVFCQIGHIEPDGTLFDHMRDPRSP